MTETKNYNNWIEQHTDDGRHFKVNTSTGEVREGYQRVVYEGDSVITPEMRDAHRKYMEEQENKRKRRSFAREMGAHYFVEGTQDFGDLTPATAARLIFLATFVGYSESGNKLFKTSKSQMHKDDLSDLLKVSKTTAGRFIDEVSPKYIAIDESGLLSLNNDIFIKGALDKSSSYYRVYSRWVQTLYNETERNQHKHLGYIFQLLPFANIDFNVLCHNPQEKNLDLVEFMTLDEFCEKIGYEKANRHRLLKIYNKILFIVNDHEERFCSIVSNGIVKDIGNAHLYVNPNILYSGSRINDVRLLGKFCKV